LLYPFLRAAAANRLPHSTDLPVDGAICGLAIPPDWSVIVTKVGETNMTYKLEIQIQDYGPF